ncbi:MAG: TPM domain-containing protein [Sulfurospirillaceae bacterium]|nr:TPM domain-containing protein [Sulfurospirillaceae bacterium]
MAKEFVINDNVIEERTAQKIEEMGQELFSKSGVRVYLIAKQNGGGENIIAFEKEFSKTLQTPYALLTFFLQDQKVDIYYSAGLEKEFDKEAMLSPLPWQGTIIPLLTEKKKEVSASAALLNGYADLVEQIAASRKITLQSAIGSSNKTTLMVIKIGVYGFVLVLLLIVLYRRIKKRD